MTSATNDLQDYGAIALAIQQYLDGARTGSSQPMIPAFHEQATIAGYIGHDLFSGPIQKLFDWNDDNGPATDLQAQIASIDLANSVATVRLEIENWTGHRFTDLFTLLKTDGRWKIVNKVFHLHD